MHNSEAQHMNTPETQHTRTSEAQHTPLPEEPLSHVAYCYDGSLEGLLSAVFEAYMHHEDPLDIAPKASFQPRLGQSVREIETDVNHAIRVQRGIRNTCGNAAWNAVVRASVSDDEHAGSIVYRFIRYAMAQKRRDVLSDLAHPAVEPLNRLSRAVSNECERMKQFIRFEHLENGVWLARCNPSASVVPLVMDWFSARFNTQAFLIFDEVHELAGVFEDSNWHLVRTDTLEVPDSSADEQLMQAAWKRFYHTVSVEARYNPELRRQFMPKRLWRNITEMQDDLPGTEITTRP